MGWTEHVAHPIADPTEAFNGPVALQHVPDDPTLLTERRNVYGNDILYVSLADGTKVGRINLGTGKTVLEHPGLREQFHKALDIWREGARDDPVPKDSAPLGERSASEHAITARVESDALERDVGVAEPEWRDLALNQPGQQVRKKAIELRRAAPVRTFVARAFGAHTEERAYRVGRDGEEEVARRLQPLRRKGWHLLHAIPVGNKGSDIDHVVIGPPGVFTLNTKHRPDGRVWVAEHSFMVNGQKTNYLRNSEFEAERASKLLSAACGFNVDVKPIIVVIAAKLTIKAQPPNVKVVARKRIAKWLSKCQPVLAPERVENIYEQARRDTTWRTGGSSSGKRIAH